MSNKTITSIFLVICFSIILASCGTVSKNSKGGIEQVDIEHIEKIFNGGDGYLLIFVDNDNNYLDTLEKVSIEKNTQILLYDPYKKDGKNENDLPVYPDEDVEGNTLYVVKKGEIKDEIDVNVYKGSQLKNEVEFILEK